MSMKQCFSRSKKILNITTKNSLSNLLSNFLLMQNMSVFQHETLTRLNGSIRPSGVSPFRSFHCSIQCRWLVFVQRRMRFGNVREDIVGRWIQQRNIAFLIGQNGIFKCAIDEIFNFGLCLRVVIVEPGGVVFE